VIVTEQPCHADRQRNRATRRHETDEFRTDEFMIVRIGAGSVTEAVARGSNFNPEWRILRDEGVPKIDASNWVGMFAPKNVPKPIVEELHDEIQKILVRADIRTLFAIGGADTVQMGRDNVEVAIASTAVALANTVHARLSREQSRQFHWLERPFGSCSVMCRLRRENALGMSKPIQTRRVPISLRSIGSSPLAALVPDGSVPAAPKMQALYQSGRRICGAVF